MLEKCLAYCPKVVHEKKWVFEICSIWTARQHYLNISVHCRPYVIQGFPSAFMIQSDSVFGQ